MPDIILKSDGQGMGPIPHPSVSYPTESSPRRTIHLIGLVVLQALLSLKSKNFGFLHLATTAQRSNGKWRKLISNCNGLAVLNIEHTK